MKRNYRTIIIVAVAAATVALIGCIIIKQNKYVTITEDTANSCGWSDDGEQLGTTLVSADFEQTRIKATESDIKNFFSEVKDAKRCLYDQHNDSGMAGAIKLDDEYVRHLLSEHVE